MAWDKEGMCYCYSMELGRTGCERFQIQCDGDWQMCLHPDVDDSCPHVPHTLCGPDNEGDGKDWVIGKHPADKGFNGVSYCIRLHVHGDGRPKLVDWIRTSPDEDSSEPEGGEGGGAASADELQPGAPVLVHGLKGARGAKINGAEGVCEAWDARAARWSVHLASGEVHVLRPRHLRLVCEDVSGFWHHRGSGVSKIIQDGAKVVITSPLQPWSPASGSISGSVLSLSAPSNVPCYAATVLQGEIRWVNNVVWHRTTEEEYAIAVARESKERMKALSFTKAQTQRGIRLGSGDSDNEEDLYKVSGPMAAFLGASRRAAASGDPDAAGWRPRLGIDLKPGRPIRGLSPKFQWKSFPSRRDPEGPQGKDKLAEADRPPPLAGPRRPLSPRSAPTVLGPQPTPALAAGVAQELQPSNLIARSFPLSGLSAASGAFPSVDEVLARLDIDDGRGAEVDDSVSGRTTQHHAPTAEVHEEPSLPCEPAPDMDDLLARVDREEQELMEKEYYEQVARIQRMLAGRL
uniref:Uncharacterized protein n=1 Tax=Alexandrium monilatum TaxID=311494 RepID=A0A7S4Q1J0_9DINO